MRQHSLAVALAIFLGVVWPAMAQGRDEALPYTDDEEEVVAPAPKKKVRQVLEETEDEAKRRQRSLASVDDPNVGLSAEFVSGVALVEASRGGVDARYQLGVRATWEWGRLLSHEVAREVLFFDVNWLYFSVKEGTASVSTATVFHHLTGTPGFALPVFGLTVPVAFFVALGPGFHSQTSTLQALTAAPTTVSASRFVFQYGGGLRFRLPLTESKRVRLSFRLEFTRFHRSYMSDSFIGGSLGLTF